ncbi:MAG: protein kinase domain-containing protein [Polyangiales bacterium]
MPSLGRYELLEPIGSGGMAKVHLGRARGPHGFERMVAVKVCHPHLRDDAAFVARFLDEARIAAKIRHPNVVATLDCGEGEVGREVGQAGDLYLVMEWIEGDRLAGLIEKSALPPPVAARIVSEALAGLQAAHDLGNIHRDVSPQNILVGVDGVTRIADFGLAKALGASTVSRDGELRGKVAYMAPEQILGGTIGPTIDVWAAGVVLWEALTGKRLFSRETEAETINAVLRFEPSAPSGIAELDAVVARALKRDPTERWATAHEMQIALENAVALPPARTVGDVVRGAPRPQTPPQLAGLAREEPLVAAPLQRPRRRTALAIALVGLGAVLAAVLLVRARAAEATVAPSADSASSTAQPVASTEAAPEPPKVATTQAPVGKPSAAPRPQVAKKPAPVPPPKTPSNPSGYWPKEP